MKIQLNYNIQFINVQKMICKFHFNLPIKTQNKMLNPSFIWAYVTQYSQIVCGQ
jgi:hypothetical protein